MLKLYKQYASIQIPLNFYHYMIFHTGDDAGNSSAGAVHVRCMWQAVAGCGTTQPGGEHPIWFPGLLRAKGLHQLSRGLGSVLCWQWDEMTGSCGLKPSRLSLSTSKYRNLSYSIFDNIWIRIQPTEALQEYKLIRVAPAIMKIAAVLP